MLLGNKQDALVQALGNVADAHGLVYTDPEINA